MALLVINWQSDKLTNLQVRNFLCCQKNFWHQNQILGRENFMAPGASLCRHIKYGSLARLADSGARQARRMDFSWCGRKKKKRNEIKQTKLYLSKSFQNLCSIHCVYIFCFFDANQPGAKFVPFKRGTENPRPVGGKVKVFLESSKPAFDDDGISVLTNCRRGSFEMPAITTLVCNIFPH